MGKRKCFTLSFASKYVIVRSIVILHLTTIAKFGDENKINVFDSIFSSQIWEREILWKDLNTENQI